MKASLIFISAALFATSLASAGNVTSTITVLNACPSGTPGDVIVTRSDVPVPRCSASISVVSSVSGQLPAATVSVLSNGTATPSSTGTAPISPISTSLASRNMAGGWLVLVGGMAAIFSL